jgi:hypothetical protein
MITFMIKKMILKMIIFSRTARTRSAEIAPRGDADLAGVPDHRPPSQHSSAKGVGDGSVISLQHHAGDSWFQTAGCARRLVECRHSAQVAAILPLNTSLISVRSAVQIGPGPFGGSRCPAPAYVAAGLRVFTWLSIAWRQMAA